MENEIILLLAFVISASVAMLGCIVGLTYNLMEWVTGMEFKWMYPVASILWITGLIPSIISLILIWILGIYTKIVL